jgi:hypothetical protein
VKRAAAGGEGFSTILPEFGAEQKKLWRVIQQIPLLLSQQQHMWLGMPL